MALRNVFVISIVLLFLFSFASAVTVTDTPTDNTSAQNFASINARLVDLTNQVQSARVDDLNARANLLKKSDLQNVYDNMVNIGKQSNLDMLTSNIVLVIVAFCILFLAIAKNMIPAHRKEDKVSTTKENMRLNKENERLQSYVDKVNAEKIRKGWFGSKRVEPVPSTPFKPIAYATGGSALAGLVQTAQTMDALAPKKKLFKKREVIPNNSASDIAVEKALNSNPHIEALKKEFNDPKAKWREELAKAKMRVDILEEMNQANEGLK